MNREVSLALEVLEALDPQSDEFKELVARLLMCVDPKSPLGTLLFNAVAMHSWSIAFEAVVFRSSPESGELEVFLRQRADDDTAYPGEWHAPGSVLRPGETEWDVANRLAREFGVPIASFQQVGLSSDLDGLKAPERKEVRGSFLSLLYIVELNGEPRLDERHGWYPVGRLPENIVHSHRDTIIPRCVEAYRDLQQS